MTVRSLIAATVFVAALALPASGQPPVHVTSWATSDIPLGIAIGPDGLLYVGAQSGGAAKAHVYDTGGVEQLWLGGTSPETYGIGFLSNGRILVAEYYFPRIDVFAPAGNQLNTWTVAGSHCAFLAVDNADNVYVTDDNGDRVRKLDSSGAPVTDWAVQHPAGIAYLNGKIYVAGMFDQTMYIFQPDGTPVGSFPTGLTRAEQVSVDSSGHLLVADWGASQLRCFSPQGVQLWVLGPSIPGYSAGTCRFTSVAGGPDGAIYVGDYDHRRVVVLGEQPTPAAPSTWGQVKDRYRR
jgi:DNA-binding beta-propeller fold protein YncE